jgi:hypothetical protein
VIKETNPLYGEFSLLVLLKTLTGGIIGLFSTIIVWLLPRKFSDPYYLNLPIFQHNPRTLALDYELFARMGENILHGHFTAAYATAENQVGPLQCILDAFLHRYIEIPFGYSFLIFLQLWFVLSTLACGILLLSPKIKRLDKWTLFAVGIAIAYSVFVEVSAALSGWGHWAQLPVLLLWVWIGRNVSKGLIISPVVMLAFAVTLEPWAILAISIFILSPTWRKRFILGFFSAIASILVSLPEELGHVGQHIWGRMAGTIWNLLAPHHNIDWSIRLLQGGLVIIFSVVSILLLKDKVEPMLFLLWLPINIVLLRIVFEAWWLPYYLSAAQILLIILIAVLALKGKWLSFAIASMAMGFGFSQGAIVSPFLTAAITATLLMFSLFFSSKVINLRHFREDTKLAL